MAKGKRVLNATTKWLLIAGGIIWGLVAIGGDFISPILGNFANYVYGAVGLSAVYEILKVLNFIKK